MSGYTQTVKVINVLKGSYGERQIDIDDRGRVAHSQSLGQQYLYFLTAEGSGYRFTFMQHAAAALPAPRGEDVQATAENMIAAAIGSPATPDTDRFWAVDIIAGDLSPNPAITKGFEDALKWTPPDEQARTIAVLVMRHYAPAITMAGSFLGHRNWADRAGPIITALGLAGGAAGTAMLAKATRNSEPEPARGYALAALGATRSLKALPALDAALHDPSPSVRLAAITGLGQSWLPEAIPLLARALDDPDERIRLAAVQALGAIRYRIGWYNLDEHDFRAHEADYLRTWKQWARENSPPAVPH